MELQVLVATMHQVDMSLVDKMNLRRDAIIANQCETWDYKVNNEDFGDVHLFSSVTRGVGINRNFALQLATADILLFADDDIRYYESDLQGVIDAFSQLPDADVIFFGIDMTKNGKVFDPRRNKVKRLHLWNSLKYGTCRMAVRRESIAKKRLYFSTMFGGGCMYGSGEDTIFIRDCFRAGLKLYSHDYVLGACAKDSSTWFSGYNNKYFFDRGAMLACAFPTVKHILKYYFAGKLHRKTGKVMSQILHEMNNGIKAFSELKVYEVDDEKDSWT